MHARTHINLKVMHLYHKVQGHRGLFAITTKTTATPERTITMSHYNN